MTTAQYAQMYLGDFLDNATQFFPNDLLKQICVLEKGKMNITKDYFLGVDIARMGEDDSTFEILDGSDKENIFQIQNEITSKTKTTDTTNKIIKLNKIWDFTKIGIDDGGVGAGVLDQLLETDEVRRKVIALNNAKRSINRDGQEKKLMKEDMYNNLLSMMEREEIKLLKNDEVIASLRSIHAEHDDKGRLRIWGSDSHITEGLIRATWLIKTKPLNIFIY